VTKAAARSPQDTEFINLSSASEDDFKSFYTNLLGAWFPADELDTLENLRSAVEDNADGILALAEGRVIGGSVYEHFVGDSVQLLGYLVVDGAVRGRGVGAELLRLTIAQSASKLALAEIEDPRYWPITERSDPVARLRFWERQGCMLLPIPYTQPALRPESRRVRHLLLIVVPQGTQSLPDEIPAPLVLEFLREYYESSEGSISDDDPELSELWALCSEGHLQLWPIDRLEVTDAHH